jgi:hypothetical protein
MSNASGRFTVDEIPDFGQQDLVSDDVMILDVWDTVYVWIGEGANKQERDEAERLAIVRITHRYIYMEKGGGQQTGEGRGQEAGHSTYNL